MGVSNVLVAVMQFLILSSVMVAAQAQAGSVVNPYTTHAQDLAVPHLVAPLYYGKRSAEPQVLGADGLVTYPNGAVAPFDPNVAVATAQHYAAKAAYGHPPAALVYGRKKREADPQLLLGAFPHPYTYSFAPVAFTPLVAHPNGAVVPLEPED